MGKSRVMGCEMESSRVSPGIVIVSLTLKEHLIHVSEAAKPKAKIREKAQFLPVPSRWFNRLL